MRSEGSRRKAWTVQPYLVTRRLAVPQHRISTWIDSRFFYTLFYMKPIGQQIEEELRHQERSVSWFARKLYCNRQNVYDIFRRTNIDAELLLRISLILGRNFFDEYVAEYEQNSSPTSGAWFPMKVGGVVSPAWLRCRYCTIDHVWGSVMMKMLT